MPLDTDLEWGAKTAPPWTINAATLFNVFSDLAYVLLLVAFFRQSRDETGLDVPVSKLLRYVTNVAIVPWSLWLTINVIRVRSRRRLAGHCYLSSYAFSFRNFQRPDSGSGALAPAYRGLPDR